MDFAKSLEKMIGLASGSNDPVAMKAVMDVQRELIQIQEENRRLRIENHELKNIDIMRSELSKQGNVYYKGEDGPYCMTCFDSEGKLIHLIVSPERGKKRVFGKCSNCSTDKIETNIYNDDWEKEQAQHARALREFRRSL